VWLDLASKEVGLHSGVADEYQISWLELLHPDGALKLFLKLVGGGEVAVEDVVMDVSKICLSVLKLPGVCGEEFRSQEWPIIVRCEKSG